MPDVEIKRMVRLSRAEAGRRLIALGEAMAGGPKSEVEFDGESIHFAVADRVEWEIELEVDGDQTELEIEMKWTDAPAAKSPRKAANKSPSKRSPSKKSPRKTGRAKATKGHSRS